MRTTGSCRYFNRLMRGVNRETCGAGAFARVHWNATGLLRKLTALKKHALANRQRPGRPNLFHGPINYGLQFSRVLHLAPFGENFSRFLGRVPGGISHLFFGVNCLLHFQQKGFYDEFLHTWLAPKNSLGVDVHMEVPRLDAPANSGFFPSFAFCGLAMRHPRMGITLGKGPFAPAIRIYQQEFQRRATPPVTDGCDLERQSKFRTRRPHVCTPPIWMIGQRYFRNVKVQQKRCRAGLPKSYYVRAGRVRRKPKRLSAYVPKYA